MWINSDTMLRNYLEREGYWDYIIPSSDERFNLLSSVKLPLVMKPEKVVSELMNRLYYGSILSGKGIPKIEGHLSKIPCTV